MNPTAGCSKHDNIFADRNHLPTHESGGARQSLPGFFYQFQLIMVWILQAVKSSLQFYISTEDDKLGKFDDFGFYRIVNDAEHRTFIQVKHKQNNDYKFQFKDFFSKQINLVQYFESYVNQVLKNDPDVESKNTKLILYTNSGIEFGSEFKNLILHEEMFEKVPYNELFNADLVKFRAEFKGRDDFINLFKTNQRYSKSDVENFLGKFYIVLNGEKMSELENKIKQHLEMFVSKRDVEKCYNQYHTNFLDWYKSKNGTKINSSLIVRYFQTIKDKITQKLHFNLLSPNINFYGKSVELRDIKNKLNSNEKSELIDIAITGTAGVGKSELARKCAQILNDEFQHILWLHAESKETLNSSFIELAKYLGISVNEKENINSVIRNVYDYLRDRKCLFIFDNAELYFVGDFSEYISTLNENHKVILTSQKQDWPCSVEIKIETFLENEAVQFLSDNLSCNEKDSELLTEIAIMLSCLPLALQLAVAYIKNMIKRKKLLSKVYTLHDFYSELTQSKVGLLKLKFCNAKVLDNYKKSIYLSWQLSINSLECEVNGDKSIVILQIMSYLQADNIPLTMFLNLCDENVLENAIYLLKSYSLIKCEEGVCSIHRLLQDVVRTKLEESGNIHEILSKTIDCTCGGYTYSDLKLTAHILNVWNYIKDNKPLRNKSLDYDLKFQWSFSFLLTFHFSMENTKSCYEILKYRLCKSYASKEVCIREKYYSLNILFSIARHLRNFREIIILYEQYVTIEDDILFIDITTFLNVITSFSFYYYKVNEYSKSILLYDKILLRMKNCKDLDFIHQVYDRKIKALMWQHKYEEALSNFSKIKPTSVIIIGSEKQYAEVKYAYFEYYTNDLKAIYLNLVYIVEGPVKCIRTLNFLFNLCKGQYNVYSIDILRWITKCYLIQGNFKCAIDSFTKIFSFLLESGQAQSVVDLQKIYILLKEISIDLEARFKPGSLTELCDKIKKFLSFFCKPGVTYKIETNWKFIIVDLLIKNGDFSRAIQILKEINSKYKKEYQPTNENNKIVNGYYRKSLCDIAMAYHLQGKTEQAKDMIDKRMNEKSSVIDLKLVHMLINTKADMLLLVNADEANKYLQKNIAFIENKYPSETVILTEIQFRIIEFLILQGRYDKALAKLEKLNENVEINTVIYTQLCMNLLQLLEIKYKHTEKFFNFFEKYILEIKCNKFVNYLYGTNKIRSDRKYVAMLINQLEAETDKFKGEIQFQVKKTELFETDYSSLTLAYVYYNIGDYINSLKIIHEMKQSKLLFLEVSPPNQDLYRFEKLVHFRMKQNGIIFK